MKKLLILCNRARMPTQSTLRRIRTIAKGNGWGSTTSFLPETRGQHLPVASDISLVLALGGDGTVLGASHLVLGRGVPVCGINLGHVGFLAAMGVREIDAELPHILCGRHIVENRMAIEVQIDETRATGLNDIILDGIDGPLFATLHLNGRTVTSYRADGLVIATPTGSTAYNLSLGGPILDPTQHLFSIVPKAPMSLLTRPLVLSADSALRITIEKSSKPVHVKPDAVPTTVIQPGTTILIHRAATSAPLVFPAQRNHFAAITERLGWNRNE